MRTIAEQLNVKKFPFEIKDKKGNKLYFENSDGYWVKREYNENNNELYRENSDGYWAKREYDENNNYVYFESSRGYWEKCEFDENNNIIYHENSYGTIIDNRKPTMTKKEAEKKFNIKIK